MNKDKHIEEMTKAIDQAKYDMWVGKAHQSGDFTNHSKNIAKYLFSAGYRQQSKGEWTRFEVNSSKGYGQVYYHHKDCELNATQLFPSPYHFCPNCGAKMDGERKGQKVSAESAIKAFREAAHEFKGTPPDAYLGLQIGRTMDMGDKQK